MRSDILIKTFQSPAAIAGYTIVTFAAGINDVEAANALGDALLGITTSIVSRDIVRCDVFMADGSEAKIGGTVSKEDVLTTDASSHAITAIQAKDWVIGLAMADAVSNDIAPILVTQG